MGARLSHRLKAMRDGSTMDRSLDAEVRFHIEMETQKYVGEGMDPDTARTRALRNFGPMEKHKEDVRDTRGVSWFEHLVQDLKYGARTLAKNPGFAALAVLTLGLGIGANTAIFSVINGVLLKPLPYANGDRLVLIRQAASVAGQQDLGVSIKELYDYRERLAGFDGIVEFHQMSFDLLRRGEPDRVDTGVVSPNFFDVLGIRPALGRTFLPADDHPGAEAVLVLSHSYWRSKFGGDPSIVGQVFEMNDRPHTVVGVLPPVPLYPREVDVYMPTSACPFRAAAERRINQNRRVFSALRVFGLLKPGVARERAAGEVATVGTQFAQEFPNVYRPDSGFQASTAGVREELTRNARPMLLILLGTTGLVLLIACANVANLALARMLKRDRELAMRTALGAGRGRLVRQLLTESTVISAAGGIVGLIFAWSTIDLLTRFVTWFTSRTGEIDIDPWVLVFTLGVSMLTALLFGTLPALAARVDIVTALKQGSKGGGVSGGRGYLQRALIVAQVAVSVVLLIGAGLLLTSFYRLQSVDAGYRADRVLAADVIGNFSKYPDAESQLRLYEPLLERLQSQPGVVSAAISNAVPLNSLQAGSTPFQIEGRQLEADRRPTTNVSIASPQYFDTLGIPLVRGRTFTPLDHRQAAPVVVINQAMIPYWEGKDPLGSRVSADGEHWFTVIGIVGNVRQYGLDREAIAQIYIPLVQMQSGLAARVLLRMQADPMSGANLIRDAVHALDRDMPIENVRTLDEIRDRYLATPRLTALLLSVFAALALVVTVAGITGVIAQSVSQRTQEFGLRIALGATRNRVLGMVLRQGLLLVAAGLVIGIAAAVALARVLQSYLYETTPTDPVTFAAVATACVIAGTLACLGPAWRATTADPMLALRAE